MMFQLISMLESDQLRVLVRDNANGESTVVLESHGPQVTLSVIDWIRMAHFINEQVKADIDDGTVSHTVSEDWNSGQPADTLAIDTPHSEPRRQEKQYGS